MSADDARSRRGAPVYVWVCRECGKRSYAKRDPIAHERRETTYVTSFGSVRHFVWCGPFDRYLCALDTERPQRDASTLPNLGKRSKSSELWDVDEGWTVPEDEEIPF